MKQDYATLDKIAREKFPADQFARVPGVIIFAEHEYEDEEGNIQRYDRPALEKIINRCNERILDTGDFAMLTKGHTPERDEVVQGAEQPDVLGFVGPYKLAKIGRVNPRYAIAADEFHHRDCHKQVSRLPRRSVEVWMAKDMGDRILDPVAALGAETPRLDLGMRFANFSTGELVQKYAGPSVASGGNTFVKQFGVASPNPKKETYAMLADDDIRQLMDAMQNTAVHQWAMKKMEAEEAQAQIGEEPAMESGMAEAEPEVFPEEPAVEEAPMEEEMKSEDYMKGEHPDKVQDEYEDMKKGEDHEADMKDMSYSKDGKVVKMSRDRHQAGITKLRKTEGQRDKYKRELDQLRSSTESIQREATDATRGAKIKELRLSHAFDVDTQLAKCLYSKGSTMSDKSFGEFTDNIVEMAPTIPAGEIPAGEIPAPPPENRQKYSEAHVARAIKYHDEKAHGENGKQIGFDDCLIATAEDNGKA